MTKKIFSLILCALLSVLCIPVQAQQTAKVPLIGFVSVGGPNSQYVEAFRRGLRDLGYIEGKNILVEYRYAAVEPERVPDFVAELVQIKVDVLVSSSTAAIHAAKQATKTIPIVMLTAQDPVAAGWVDSLARPGGNITGLTRLSRELSGKRLELLKEVVPGLSRVGVLAAQGSAALKQYEVAARAQKMPFQSLDVRGPNPDFEGAFQAAVKGQVNALITIGNRLINRYRKQMADLALKNRLPSMYEEIAWVEAGGLMSYAADDFEIFRRAATYVDRILKGVKPTELPVEQPTKFELVINLRTAKQLGLIIPAEVLRWADEVIK